MPASSRDPDRIDQGPIEQLLSFTKTILLLESRLRLARLLRFFMRLCVVMIPAGIAAIYVATVVTWHKVNLSPINVPAILVILALGAYLVGYFYVVYINIGPQDEPSNTLNVPRLTLELELARERRRLHAANINLDLRTHQLIYRDTVPQDIERYRSEGKYYRRVHNFLQSIIIIGALAASTLTGLLQSVPQLRWFAVGTTFAVGVAAGFTGYFKYRERSFYLQQTSDSIEQELSAVILGIGRYKAKPEPEALTDFTEQVELLKTEQRKRQQQLEQPSEGRDGTQ